MFEIENLPREGSTAFLSEHLYGRWRRISTNLQEKLDRLDKHDYLNHSHCFDDPALAIPLLSRRPQFPSDLTLAADTASHSSP